MLLLSVFVFPALSSVAEEATATSDSIFMGMNLFVEVDGVEYPMVGFKSGLHLYYKDGQLEGAPRPAKINFRKSIRHSDQFASLFDFETRPYSTEVARLMERYMDAIQQQMNFTQPLEYSLQSLSNLSAGGGMGPAGMSNVDAEIQRNQQVAVSQATAAVSTSSASLNNMQSMARGIEQEIGEKSHEEHFDTLLISLKFQPEEDLEDCYLFVRAKYLDGNGANPEEEAFNIQIAEIGNIQAGETNPVHFAMTGFPEGPQILEMSYHLFSGDREVPTEYSEQRIHLSEEEAYDFLYADLFTELDPPDTDPSLFKLLSREVVPASLTTEKSRSIRVSLLVTAMGEVDQVQILNCPDELVSDVERVIIEAKFLPAVEDGTPVDRQVEFVLDDIFRS